MNRFVQGRPSNTLIEQFIERHLQSLVTLEATSSAAEVSRLRNYFTYAKMRELLLRHGYKSAYLKMAEPDYYDRTLEERSEILQSPIETLCKTMVMENTAYNPEFEG